ncbi:MAG: Flavodoxin domain protein [Methanomassiliicoccales archaeon PtaU1.Bin124]|nr:MAG: Flavodoxin domain protein [Methanomassiliicoccales archaeon PtaU1.Bin124]
MSVTGVIPLRIEVFHASKYGNGANVAEEIKTELAAKGHQVSVHHMKEVKPKQLPQADLYIFGSPGRIGKPIGLARRFLKNVILPSGTKYAIFSTEAPAQPDKKTGKMPTPEEIAKWQRIKPIMDELLKGKGLVKVGDMTVHVVNLKGPLEENWQRTVEEFVAKID